MSILRKKKDKTLASLKKCIPTKKNDKSSYQFVNKQLVAK